MRRLGTAVTFLSLLILPYSAIAAGFDGSQPLLCVLMKAMECTAAGGCSEVVLDNKNTKQFLKVDFENKTIKAAGEDTLQSIIEKTEHIDGKLIVQGAEDGVEGVKDGVGWTAAIMEDSGKLILTASGDEVGFVIFGACITQ